MLTYAALVWGKRTHLTAVKTTTPTATMETLLGLPLLQHVVEKEARQAAYRLHCSKHFEKSD
jgi:hypothetical protein